MTINFLNIGCFRWPSIIGYRSSGAKVHSHNTMNDACAEGDILHTRVCVYVCIVVPYMISRQVCN